MAKIIQISGGTIFPLIFLKADKRCLFEAIDWSTAVTTSQKITWRLMDTEKKNILKTIKENALVEESIAVTIDKKYSGYTYYLEAELAGTGEKAGVYIYGHSEKRIIGSKWSKTKGGGSESNPVKYGEPVFLHLETEGLNGQELTVEVYNDEIGFDNKVRTYTGVAVANGEVNLKINNSYSWRSKISMWVSGIEPFYIKVKNTSGTYIKDSSGKDLHAKYLNIENKIESKDVSVPENLTPLKIGEPDVSVLSVGIIELTKVEVVTDFAVCNDSYTDIKDLWMLEHGGSTKYHWLKNSLRTASTNNNKRPNVIPVIIRNDKILNIKATFNTIIPADNIKIRVKDKKGNYLFPIKPHKKTKEFTIEFKSLNKPFINTIQHIKDFKLGFEYTFDEKIWFPLGEVPFNLYIPWKDPSVVYSKLDTTVSKMISGKKLIRETLIWLGCKSAKGLGNDTSLTTDKNEEKILDAVFTPFKSLKVLRKREGKTRLDGTNYLTKNFPSEGMGYWRGESLPTTTTGVFATSRSLSFLLSEGEARCGEWTTFFQNILLTLGIDVSSDTVGICTRVYQSYFGYSNTSSGFNLADASHNFAVKNALHDDTTNPDSTSGDSPGQGTSKSQPTFVDHFWFYYIKQGRFFDASYGKCYSSTDSNLKNYSSDNINSVFVEGITITPATVASPATATSPAIAASPATAALNGTKTIKKTNTQDYIYSDRALF